MDEEEDVTPFTDLKLTGGRYEQKGFPLASLPELERYERIVLEVAKELWRESHPQQQRLPHRFAEQLDLRLRRVQAGSVVPVLTRSASQTRLGIDDVFNQAQEKVDEEFAKIVAGDWDDVDLPPRAFQAFRRFGSSLRGKEAFLFRANSTNAVRYDQDVRSRYLSHRSGGNVEREGYLVGVIRGLDADAKSFRLLSPSSTGAIPGHYDEAELFAELHAALSDDVSKYYRLDCAYQTSPSGAVVVITNVVDVELFLSVEETGGNRLIELAQLEPGWLDGAGQTIDLSAIEFVRDLLDDLVGEDLPRPRIYPTEEGGVQLEWHSTTDKHTEVEIMPSLDIECYHLGPDGEKFDFPDNAKGVIDFLKGII